MAGSLLAFPFPAHAQSNAELLEELKAMRAKIDALESKVVALEAERSATATAPVSLAPAGEGSLPARDGVGQSAAGTSGPKDPDISIAWRGAPQFTKEDDGSTFKVHGFVQFDVGSVENPGNAIPTDNLGFSAVSRRLVIGASGDLPGGFGYKAEFNFGLGELDYEDIVLTYSPETAPIELTLGNFFPLTGLESSTSSRLGSVIEREQASDAFALGRRIGAALAYSGKDYALAAGIFGTTIQERFENDSWQASVRGYYAPKVGENSLVHVGASFQHRVASSAEQSVRYRARPFTRLTDYRFVDTGEIAASGDSVVGLELVGIFGPFHFASEGHRLHVNSKAAPAHPTSIAYASNPVFASGYAEIGYYLTGDTRGYRKGRWDNLKVARPIHKGGLGALQINARIDHLDLTDQVGEGRSLTQYINGGRQTGYELSAIWNPIDQVRFMLHYSHIEVVGGPGAALVRPDAPLPEHARDYSVEMIGFRSQVEF